MEKRQLGDSGVEVSAVALGSWLTYSGGIGREQTEACTRAAFDAGVTLFDTANVYGTGAAETRVGRDPARLRTRLVRARDQGLLPDGPARPRPLAQADPQADRRLAGAAADRLRRPLPVPPLRRHRRARGDDGRADRGRRVRQGAVDRLLRVARGQDRGGFVAARGREVRLRRSRSTRRCGASPRPRSSRVCEANGITQIVWSPLAQGVLTGKYLPGEKVPADSRAANKSMNRFIKQWLSDETLRAVQALRPIADEAGVTLSQLALAWVLSRPNVSAVIVGATRPEQVHENVAAADVAAERRHGRGDRRRAQNSGGVVSSGSIRQPPSGSDGGVEELVEALLGGRLDQPPRHVAQPGGRHRPLARRVARRARPRSRPRRSRPPA